MTRLSSLSTGREGGGEGGGGGGGLLRSLICNELSQYGHK